MKKIKEIFFGSNGLFTIFAENFVNEFNTYFENTEPEIIDTYVLYMYGDRNLNNSITETNVVTFIKSIITMYLPIWSKLNDTLNLSYSPNKADIETHTKTGNITRVGDNTNVATNAEKVFNDTEFVDGGKTVTDTDTENTETYNLTETITRQGNEVTKSIKYEYDFRRENSIQNEILKNLVNAISLKIY